MQNLEELYQTKLEFDKLAKEKCSEYCIIHGFKNPFEDFCGAYNIRSYILGYNLIITYKEDDRCGGYEDYEIKVPLSFCNSSDHSKEEQKAIEKAKLLISLRDERNKLLLEERTLKAEMNSLGKDIDDLGRLLKTFNITTSSPEYENTKKRYSELSPILRENSKKLAQVNKQIQELE